MWNFSDFENETSQRDDEDLYAVSDGVRIMQATAIAFLGITGAIGNFLVILSIATTPDLRTLHNAFVLNLSVSDFLLSAVTCPLNFASVLLDRWPLGSVACRLCVQISLALMGVSLLTLAAVASNRYFLISKPRTVYERFCGRRKVLANIVFMWLQAVIIGFVVAEFVARVKTDFNPLFGTCALDPFHPSTWVFITVLIVLVIFTSLVVIPLQYFLMFRTIRASKRRVRGVVGSTAVSTAVSSGTNDALASVASQGAVDPDTASVQPSIHKHRPRRNITFSKEEIRLVKMSFFVTLLFVVCWLPQSLTYVLGPTYPVLFRAARFEFSLLLLGPAGNPFIYAWMNTNMRRACLRLIKCQKCRGLALH
ncbi:melanopsin-A-like [Patiria miniata]|uniref:G-protein coupled receptors family 1 profile domain-containing protein n=1 Tax=Patiria miniata TaxID=46514 RepID=A0A914AKT4_PATMI|nr:melanopsin-A-like [Patiria miniata]